MQQTSLNLIAIGIFTVTISALLGPIFNIPPAIPAAATFSILGLATLDNLGFQGKGVTLLLDWLSRTRSDYRDRILRHEAGHFLIAYLLGIPVTGYTLTAWEALKQGQPGLGGVTFDTQQLSPNPLAITEMQLTLNRFCTVWMAGIAAETLIYDTTEGGLDDRQKLREALTALGRPASESTLKERWATLQAQTLLQNNWTAYEALVTAMEKRTPVTECYKLIQEHCQASGESS
ncbi:MULTISPECIES: ATP-dependent Zn protease [unclassified Coleofasciculus]|uniref:ATP-dependent Zn protease n=1 Tax=unclassified Coleofasciculus TaxID=2692782 RepID=UPI0018805C87|nr:MULTISPECIES: ATP-dependent Zn protease [unclassified Coleofasciculus]MBE9125206.1 ATP-dependent Zn protease [Coleofasciculus sp. LEGE 07081]MBE9148783.1 ATP-dependent Zn protease [Coleofasciculus sp. LEGE 07092]